LSREIKKGGGPFPASSRYRAHRGGHGRTRKLRYRRSSKGGKGGGVGLHVLGKWAGGTSGGRKQGEAFHSPRAPLVGLRWDAKSKNSPAPNRGGENKSACWESSGGTMIRKTIARGNLPGEGFWQKKKKKKTTSHGGSATFGLKERGAGEGRFSWGRKRTC